MKEELQNLSQRMNKTGMSLAPRLAPQMLEVTGMTEPTSSGDEAAAHLVRKQYNKAGDPIGSVPIPATLKGISETVLQRLKGARVEVFLDKLGERMAFERSGTRLYDLILAKCEARPDEVKNIDVGILRQIRDEELAHFEMLQRCIKDLGGDPTAVTPAANVAATMSMGLFQVASDPRTSVAQALDAIHVAELTDNDCWAVLVKLAGELELDDLVNSFEKAYVDEQRHLSEVRDIHQRLILGEAMPNVH